MKHKCYDMMDRIDLLTADEFNTQNIPEDILNHIKNCQSCRKYFFTSEKLQTGKVQNEKIKTWNEFQVSLTTEKEKNNLKFFLTHNYLKLGFSALSLVFILSISLIVSIQSPDVRKISSADTNLLNNEISNQNEINNDLETKDSLDYVYALALN